MKSASKSIISALVGIAIEHSIYCGGNNLLLSPRALLAEDLIPAAIRTVAAHGGGPAAVADCRS